MWGTLLVSLIFHRLTPPTWGIQDKIFATAMGFGLTSTRVGKREALRPRLAYPHLREEHQGVNPEYEQSVGSPPLA